MSDVVTLENDDVSVHVLSREGGRVTHLVNRRDGREWLMDTRGSGQRASLEATYCETDHGGWDEMLPTIDPCVYPVDPYRGIRLADHGELWSATWEAVDRTATSLHQRATGRQLAFTFERVLEIRGAVLRASYWCDVPTTTAMLWAVHPQFAVGDGTRLTITPTPSVVLDSSRGEVGPRPWTGDLVVERDVAAGTDLMVYVDPDETVTSAALEDPSGSSLTMTWDADFARYLAVWVDHGRLTRGRVIAIEPSNGYYDDLARAMDAQRVTLFEAHRPRTWWLDVALAAAKEEDR